MYQFKELRDGSISVYRNNRWSCIIEPAFALHSGYATAMEYCKAVFI